MSATASVRPSELELDQLALGDYRDPRVSALLKEQTKEPVRHDGLDLPISYQPKTREGNRTAIYDYENVERTPARRTRRIDSQSRLAVHRAGVTPQVRRGAKPDRIAMWAVLMGFFLVAVAASGAHAATSLGERTLKPGMEGRDVRHLQLRLKRMNILHTSATAHYGSITKGAVKRFQRTRCLATDGIAGPSTIKAIRRRAARCSKKRRSSSNRGLHPHQASWYGPGLYGNGTACGHKLTTKLLGVAHKYLPCGTRVRLTYQGRTIVVPVVDRGPYVKGRYYDLTAATAKRLGFDGTGTVFSSI